MVKIYTYDCVVIGSGAAGFNAINRLKSFSNKKVALLTEGVKTGTSRNTGSDKQTYYKLGLSGSSLDSIYSMANNLFSFGSVDGDNALIEAALSSRCFLNLVELGVPFPCNRYGEYIGYKTDHDPYERATSAGPLTSKFMTECLEKRAKELKVEILDNLYAIEIIKNKNEVAGLLCLNKTSGELVLINTPNVIIATGGPAGIYSNSVYPIGHTGSTSLAIKAGASLQNVTEWQYGLASTNPRWNVSGTYMQVLPRFVSIDKDKKEHEFLKEYFTDNYQALNNVFLKGYQWPFDSNKVLTGSSVIDLLVYKEIAIKGRKVYLDYMHNPFNLKKIDLNKLSNEAKTYLVNAGANQDTPIKRLEHMNKPAIELYKSKGVNLYKEYLEVAVCSQHHNGGIAVDMWWQTRIKGLFACGECAGTHGVSRPGGSALNAGQVGSLRASTYISQDTRKPLDNKKFLSLSKPLLDFNSKFIKEVITGKNNVDNLNKEYTLKMSNLGSFIRDEKNIKEALKNLNGEIKLQVKSKKELIKAYKFKDVLLTQKAVLLSMLDYLLVIKKSRGSALYYQKSGKLREGLDELFRFIPDDGKSKSKIQEIRYEKNNFLLSWRDVRKIPDENNFFENVWREYRKNKNVY